MPSSEGAVFKKGIKRLDAETLEINCYQPGSSAKRDITNETLIFEARYKTADETPVISKTSADETEIEKVDAANGVARVYIYEDDTQQFSKTATLKCQVIQRDSLGRDNTVSFDVPLTFRN